MTSHRDWFTKYVSLTEHTTVVIGDSTELAGIGFGDVELEAYNGQK